jgi:hypothetical protein
MHMQDVLPVRHAALNVDVGYARQVVAAWLPHVAETPCVPVGQCKATGLTV